VLAHDFMKMSKYPSIQEAIYLIQDGNIANMPMLAAEDVKRAFDLFSQPVGSISGKMTKKKIGYAVHGNDLVIDEKKQVLYSDVIIFLLQFVSHYS